MNPKDHRLLPIDVESPSHTYYTVQALRAVAALMVVLDHCILGCLTRVFHRTGGSLFWTNGTAGVDIFFAISGFVMIVQLQGLTKYRNPIRQFLQRRVTRIVPLYWLSTTLKVAILMAAPVLAHDPRLSLSSIIGSYLFIFMPDARGELFPVIPVGWTLNFEMFFYVMFAFAMLFKNRLLWVLAGLLGVLAIVGMFYQPTWWSVTRIASSLLLEFLFGAFIGRLAMNRRLPGGLMSGGLLAVGFVFLLTIHTGNVGVQYQWRFLFWGVPAAAIVLGAVGLEKRLGRSIPKWLVSLGDSSYAIYLIQVFVLPCIGIAIAKSGLVGRAAASAWIVGGLVLTSLAGEVTHRYIELPILSLFKSRRQRVEVSVVGQPR
jgi:peptidoglycan/LPS O-acetylase OafA/YrhL